MKLPTTNCQLPTFSETAMRKRGFTLIELSIVIVIIGLIVGGVMVGKELLNTADMRSQVSEIQQYNAAVLTFESKYDCLPGDCSRATTYFTSSSQPEKVTNGNSDGLIFGYYNSSDASQTIPHQNYGWAGANYGNYEYTNVFDQLAAAKLISMGQYNEENATTRATLGVAFPALKIKSLGQGPIFAFGGANYRSQGGLVIGHEPPMSYIPGGNKFRLGACPNTPTDFSCGLNPWEAEYIDTKLDDGKPFSGTAVIVNSGYTYRVPGAAWAISWYNYCENSNGSNMLTAGNLYRNQRNILSWGGSSVHRFCALSIKAEF